MFRFKYLDFHYHIYIIYCDEKKGKSQGKSKIFLLIIKTKLHRRKTNDDNYEEEGFYSNNLRILRGK